MSILMITSNAKREWKELDKFTKEDLDLDITLRTLSNNQRWAGKASMPWSILDHCLMAYKIALYNGEDSDVRLYALLHDFPESVTGDVISPIKTLIPDYDETIERPLLMLFYDLLGVKFYLREQDLIRVKKIDKLCAEVEEYVFFNGKIPNSMLKGDLSMHCQLLMEIASFSIEDKIDEVKSLFKVLCI